MKTFTVILNILAVVLNIIVLTYTFNRWMGIEWRDFSVLFSYGTRCWFFDDFINLLFYSIFPIVNLVVLLNKYSMMDEWLVRFFNWNLKKRYLLCVWMLLTAIFGVSFFIIIYIEHYRVWGYFSWHHWGFVFHALLVVLIILGFVITFKNKRDEKLKDKQKQFVVGNS